MAHPVNDDSQVQLLALRLVACIAGRLKPDVRLADLQPGGGQNDCLALITAENPNPVFMVNRLGSSAIYQSQVFENIWQEMERIGTDKVAEQILHVSSGYHEKMEASETNVQLSESCNKIADWIEANLANKPRLICGWFDGQDYVGSRTALIDKLIIPASWRAYEPPYPGTDWSAWLFILTGTSEQGELVPIAVVNMKNSEAINVNGFPWDFWSSRKKVYVNATKQAIKSKPKIAINRDKRINSVSLPPEGTNEEAMKIFRKVGNFDGYKAMGGQEALANFANSVMERWNKDGILPESIDAIKAALFFEFRRSRFMSGYPDSSQMPYLVALADAIDNFGNAQKN